MFGTTVYKSHNNCQIFGTRKQNPHIKNIRINMVVYVKNNALLVPLVMLFLLVSSSYGRFNVKISEGEVSTICSKAKNPSFCSNFFRSTPQTKTLNLPGVAKLLINDASREALDTQKQFESLAKGATDPRSKNIYTQCSENYENALSEFNAALQALADMDSASLNIKVSAAMTNGDSCNSELPSVKPSPQLLKKIYDIDNLSGIVLVISNILPKK